MSEPSVYTGPIPEGLPDTVGVRQKLARLAFKLAKREAERLKQADDALDVKLRRARRDYRAFAELVLKDEKTREAIVMARHQLQWLEHIDTAWQRGLHPWILAPYSFGKSVHMAVGIPLFAIGRDPSIRIKIVSASDDLARERVAVIRQYIETSAEYKLVFPDVRPSPQQEWTRTKIFVSRPTLSRDATVEAKGATGSIMGKRSDLVIFDDINDKRNTINYPRLRQQVWGNVSSFISRLEPGSRFCGIGTRYHDQDCVGRILENDEMREKYAFLIQRVSDDFESLDYEVYYGDNPTLQAGESSPDALEKLFAMHEAGLI